MFPTPFYEASIIQITKTKQGNKEKERKEERERERIRKEKKEERKLQANTSGEDRCKNSQKYYQTIQQHIEKIRHDQRTHIRFKNSQHM